MNKLILLIMSLFGLTSCTSGNTGVNLNGKKALVAYYSWGGNTKAVGDYIAETIGADVYEIESETAYPVDYDECVEYVGQHGSQFEPKLKPISINLDDYDVIFVGSPCWWGTISNPLRSFLHQNKFEGKTVIPFMTNGTSGKKLQEVEKLCPGAIVLDGLSIYNRYQIDTKINTPDNMGNWKNDVDDWLKSIMKK